MEGLLEEGSVEQKLNGREGAGRTKVWQRAFQAGETAKCTRPRGGRGTKKAGVSGMEPVCVGAVSTMRLERSSGDESCRAWQGESRQGTGIYF